MPFSDDQLREIVRFSATAPIEPPEAALQIEAHFGLPLPETFKRIHGLGGGAQVVVSAPDRVEVGCDFHALGTNPFEHYGSTILAAHAALLGQLDKCREAFQRVLPFGQDGAGSQFCLDYRTCTEPLIARFDWEYQLVARSFDEFIEHASRRRPKRAISAREQREFLALLPEDW